MELFDGRYKEQRRQMDQKPVAFLRLLKKKLIRDKVFSSTRINSEFVAKVMSVVQQQLTEGSNLEPPAATPGNRPPAAAAPNLGLPAVSVQPSASQEQLTGGISSSETPTVAAGVSTFRLSTSRLRLCSSN